MEVHVGAYHAGMEDCMDEAGEIEGRVALDEVRRQMRHLYTVWYRFSFRILPACIPRTSHRTVPEEDCCAVRERTPSTGERVPPGLGAAGALTDRFDVVPGLVDTVSIAWQLSDFSVVGVQDVLEKTEEGSRDGNPFFSDEGLDVGAIEQRVICVPWSVEQQAADVSRGKKGGSPLGQ